MSKSHSVWVSRPLFPEVLASLARYVELSVENKETKRTPEQLHEKLAAVDGAIVGLSDRIEASVLAGNRRLRVIANLGVGYNNLDLPALTAAGILATNTPDVLTQTTADYAWALMLAAARRVSSAERWLRAGRWRGGMRFDDWLGVDVHGKTLGILGMGRIGQAIARRARRFRYAGDLPQPFAAARGGRARMPRRTGWRKPSCCSAPIIWCWCCRIARKTIMPSVRAELAQMKPTAVLVNIARGGIVDDAALAAALREGTLGRGRSGRVRRRAGGASRPMRTRECRAQPAYRQRQRRYTPRDGQVGGR